MKKKVAKKAAPRVRPNAYARGFAAGANETKADGYPLVYEQGREAGLAEARLRSPRHGTWSSLEAATTPGLYLVRPHAGLSIAARLILMDDGKSKELSFIAESGDAVASHCVLQVFGPIEEGNA